MSGNHGADKAILNSPSLQFFYANGGHGVASIAQVKSSNAISVIL